MKTPTRWADDRISLKNKLVLILLLLSLFVALRRPLPADALGERLVLAFYYAWYGWDTWQSGLPDQPQQPYVSSDPAAIERHVAWAQQAGIDAFVQSWYGPQVENNQTETNFAMLLEIARQRGFQAAVDFEVTSPFFRSEGDVIEGLRYLLNVHAQHPAYLRVGGRPVIFFWRQNRFSVDWWCNVRQQLDPQHMSIWIMEGVDLDYLGPFDGTHLYSVAWDAQPAATLRRWGERIRSWNAEHGSVKFWVATVMPGYNDLVTGRADAFVRERADGAYYRDCWEGAIQSGADWVIITSFNEWPEGTYIEPSVAYGDLYLRLTRELGDFYRASEPLPPGVPGDPIIVNPTATPVVEIAATAEPPTATVEPVPQPTATATAAPTVTPLPTATPTALPTATPVAEAVVVAVVAPAASATATATVEPVQPQQATPARLDWRVAVGAVALLLGLGLLLVSRSRGA